MGGAYSTWRQRAVWKAPLLAVLGLVMLGWSDDLTNDRPTASRDRELIYAETRGPTRLPIRGTDFPDGVLALTWDDGPDANTLELARYLHSEKIAASFFVVGEWIDGVSEEPGVGDNVYKTGYRDLPVLAELVALGHRIGGHTENHVLLGGAAPITVSEQLGQGQHEIDPFLGNELRMFRAPGGSWSRSAALPFKEPFLADIIGPVHWDIDGKDWEGSLYCRATAAECEPGPIPGRTRVRPDVVARRYVSRAEDARHGIVLLHDRVGHVGSRYALDVAHRLIPDLKARGFVFAAPVLAFGPLTRRFSAPGPTDSSGASTTFADIDGDGHDDFCREASGSIVCARGATSYDPHAIPHATFAPAHTAVRVPNGARAMDVADIDGDGRADICIVTDEAIDCARATPDHGFAPLQRWSTELSSLRSSTYARSFRLADIDGDGRADACMRGTQGVLCSTSTGQSTFGRPRVWLGRARGHEGSAMELADLDGDGRADLCAGGSSGVACALSTGHSFAPASTWSVPGDLSSSELLRLRLADVNGDGRADVCAAGKEGVACALSSGHAFKRSSVWSTTSATDLRLADLNGDGRSDLCVVTKGNVECGLAP